MKLQTAMLPLKRILRSHVTTYKPLSCPSSLVRSCNVAEDERAVAFCAWELSEGHTQWGPLKNTRKTHRERVNFNLHQAQSMQCCLPTGLISKKVPLPYFLLHLYTSTPERQRERERENYSSFYKEIANLERSCHPNSTD